jgi:hypothetical protein
MTSPSASSVRHGVLAVTIGSFAIAALMGITALLVPGRFGSTQGRVLLTTVVVGVTSVLALCYLAIGETRHRWIGLVGAVAAIISAVSLLDIIWAHWQHDPGRALLRTFGVSGILALTLAQFSLLLAVVRARGTVARLLWSTLAAGTVLAGLLVAVVLGWNPGDGAARLIGVVAILDVLGTVVSIALGVFGGNRNPSARGMTVVVPGPLAAQLRARAEASGRDPVDLVLEAVEHCVGSASAEEISSGEGQSHASGSAPDPPAAREQRPRLDPASRARPGGRRG